jgi:transcriptional regulator with XRE-family HTH domain
MRGGLLISEARRRAGLTQTELAERLGTQQPVVARWETGRAEPAYATVERVLAACGFELVPSLRPVEESEERLLDLHLAMTPSERVAVLHELLRIQDQVGGGPHAA